MGNVNMVLNCWRHKCNIVVGDFWNQVVAASLFVMLNSILTIVTALSCDKAEKGAIRLAKLCSTLQSDIQDSILIEELNGLSEFIMELRPKFTVYGFFNVNQQTIPVFISALTTYLIILIQFKVQK
uniref:Gustatory receptor 68a-like isoform X3 n=2 Tax=Diabrotica virgifera virgifera TaxID=50390 RepID=A0A6P7FAJ5_DIAVI